MFNLAMLFCGFVIGFVLAMWLLVPESRVEEEVKYLKLHAEEIVRQVEMTLTNEAEEIKHSRAVEALKKLRPSIAIQDIRLAITLAFRKLTKEQ